MNFMNAVIVFLISIAAAGEADTLQGMVSTRIKAIPTPLKLDLEQTAALSGVIPFQSFEYRYGRRDETDAAYRVNMGGETHGIRIHIKSPAELLNSNASRRLSQQLVDAETRESLNQSQFDVYMDIVQDALQARLHKMLSAREGELQKNLKNSSQMMGLAKADVKELVKELDRLKRVDAEFESSKARRGSSFSKIEKEAVEAAGELIDSVGAVAKRLVEVEWQAEQLQIQRKRTELQLARIDKEISWSQDRKLLDSVDLRRNTFGNEESIRVTFNVPFLRFDNENRARDKAILASKQSSLEREASELSHDLRRKKVDLLGIAAQVESLKGRLARTKGIDSKIKDVRDHELRAVLADFNFELERDVVLESLKFYTAYLEFLRDQGAFAIYANQNLLKPGWPELSP